jgi:hypothetical protein
MHGGWQLFSPILLVKVEGRLLIKWVALYALVSVWRRGEMKKHTRVRSLAGPDRAGRGMVRRGDGRGCTKYT